MFRFFLIFMSFSFPVQAYYPASLWSSDRIKENLVGIKAGFFGENREIFLVGLTPKRLILFQVEGDRLVEKASFKGGVRDEWIKLNLFDLEGDGIDEILVSGLYGENIHSFIAKYENNKIIIINNLNYYLSIITLNNEEEIVAQKRLGEDDFTGPLIRMKWNGKLLEKGGEIILPSGLSGESLSLYSLQGVEMAPDQRGFIHLSPSGRVVYFQETAGKYKRQWTSGGEYGGSVLYLNRPVKNALNQVQDKRFFVPLTFLTGSQIFQGPIVPPPPVSMPEHCFDPDKKEAIPTPPECVIPSLPRVALNSHHLYLIKNEGYLKNVMGAVPSIKNSQIVRLTWTGYGFQEDWNSPRFDGALSDFDLVDWDGNGDLEILAILLLRDKGYVDTLKKQDSLLIVIDVK